MPRRRGRGRDDLAVKAEINVTSLVDVAFTLLIIFIITAPILQGGVEVDVPRADVEPLTSSEKPFIVSVRPDGAVFVEETRLSLAEFESSFPQMAEAGTFEKVYLRGDSLAAYGTMMRVMTAIRATGKPFALVAAQRDPAGG